MWLPAADCGPGSPLLLLAVALLPGCLQALRATKVNRMIALRKT
jgi:hypothetical protein